MSSSPDEKDPMVSSISQAVTHYLEDYFSSLGQEKPSNLYLNVLTLLEKPLFESVMKQCRYKFDDLNLSDTWVCTAYVFTYDVAIFGSHGFGAMSCT